MVSLLLLMARLFEHLFSISCYRIREQHDQLEHWIIPPLLSVAFWLDIEASLPIDID